MIDFTRARLSNCAVHYVGNKSNDENLHLSDNELALDADAGLPVELAGYFLKPFKNTGEAYRFTHEIDLNMNEVFTCAANIFKGESLIDNSRHLAKHLFAQTRHPAVKPGELFIAVFEETVYEDFVGRAVGIFKSEHKDNFFKVNETPQGLSLQMETGIGQHKLDKGCIIVRDGSPDGFKVFTYEHNNADTDYWRNDFLSIAPLQDNYYQTKNFLNLCKDFVKEQLPDQFEVTRADQVDYLNRSVEYFKRNEDFKVNEFVNEVFEEPGIIKSFKNFKDSYQQHAALSMDDEFGIHQQAVKKQAKYFKSVIKLDKNFHVYVHGDKEMIERGYDEAKGLHFYKIYYKVES
jgi:37-kD nucleoid-associated bacterial protein